MKICNNKLNFGNRIQTTAKNNIFITDEFNDKDIKIKHTEYDVKNDRFIRQDIFDEKGNPIEQWWFEYSKNKQVEHFDSKKNGSYIRTIINKIVDGLQVQTEEFISKTDPTKNYLYEITRNYDGKMQRFLCNGKKVF